MTNSLTLSSGLLFGDVPTLEPDPEVQRFIFGLFSKEAMIGYGVILAKILIVIVLTVIIKQIANHMIEKVFRNRITLSLSRSDAVALEEKRLATLSKLAKSIVSYILYFIAIISCLDMVGFSITTIVAGAGVLSLAVAFGAQNIVQDLMSGIFIVLENQYAVGEIVLIDGVQGVVKEIGMKTTKLETLDGHLMVIANGNIGKIINYSRAAQRDFVDVGIAYEENLDHAIEIMQKACDQVAEVFKEDLDEAPNVVGAIELGDSAVTVRATFTAWNWKQLPIERALRKELKNALDEAGIEISYPKVQLVGPDLGKLLEK